MRIIPVSEGKELAEMYIFRINPATKIIYLIILISVIFVLCMLPLIYVDISVQARGFLQPETEKQTLFAPTGGKIIYTDIRTGKRVEKGDTLFIIESETLRTQKIALLQRIAENNSSIQDLRMLVQAAARNDFSLSSHLKQDRYVTDIEDLRKQYLVQQQKYQKAEKDHKRNTILFEESLIPLSEYETSAYNYDIERENLSRLMMTSASKWHYELSQRKLDSVIMAAELNRYNEEIALRIVTAPVAGEIIVSSELQEGSIVLQNQKMLDISPDGIMMANVFVRPADIGFVRKGQAVRIQVDAFNFNEWGMLEGEITDISDDLYIEDNQNPFFRVRCLLKSGTLSLKNGYEARIKKGMSVTARVIVTRRSIYNLLFDKVSKWLNPYINNQSGIWDTE